MAYEDFSHEQLERRLRELADPADAGDKQLIAYLSRIENFSFEVGFGNRGYTVWISPRASADMPVIFGGGAAYQIDGKTFKIVSRSFSK